MKFTITSGREGMSWGSGILIKFVGMNLLRLQQGRDLNVGGSFPLQATRGEAKSKINSTHLLLCPTAMKNLSGTF